MTTGIEFVKELIWEDGLKTFRPNNITRHFIGQVSKHQVQVCMEYH